jgi:hypothetical protein
VSILIDASRAPLIITTASGVLNDTEYAAHLDECTKLIVQPARPYAYVYDGTRIDQMPSSCRQLQATWINTHRPVIGRLNRGCGFAFASAITRGLLTAVHWISPPPYPHSISATRDDAIRWCLDRLVRAGDMSRESAGLIERALVRREAPRASA